MGELTDRPVKSFEELINDLIKALINSMITESQALPYGDNELDKMRKYLQNAGENTLHAITAMSAYAQARAADRQATAIEALSKTISRTHVSSRVMTSDSTTVPGQSIVDQRESKRDYLATTYSYPSETLALLWAVRGILTDASFKALSNPAVFEPYRKVTSAELAWSLRLSPEVFLNMLPKSPHGSIDFTVLEDFDIYHYDGTDEEPDGWMFGG